MAFETAAGTTLRCAVAAPATFDAAGYVALTFVNIGEITNAGEFVGKVYNLVTHSPLSSRGVKKGKGSFNNGQVSPDLAFDFADSGQVILATAAASDVDATSILSFELTTQSGHIVYFQGLVMSNPMTVGENDSIVMGKPMIEITDKPIIQVAA
jgi:hypothetical protein